MQIGLPTDVKHVAHIGMDGPSANKPSWMNEFNSAPELSSGPPNSNPKPTPSAAGNNDSLPPLSNGNEKPKKSRRKASIGSGSPVGSPKSSEKQPRRPRSSNLSMGSPSRDPSSHGRRNRNSSRGSTDQSSSQDLSEVSRKSRRKKSKESAEGSTSSSRSKRPNSLPDSDAMELESCGGDIEVEP
ncbi:hypothetical protein PTKIN_Ptkin10aG0037200 [Pterospermum kingtungense]